MIPQIVVQVGVILVVFVVAAIVLNRVRALFNLSETAYEIVFSVLVSICLGVVLLVSGETMDTAVQTGVLYFIAVFALRAFDRYMIRRKA